MQRVTDYPAAHKGQPRSLPVEIIQSAGGFTAGVLRRRSYPRAPELHKVGANRGRTLKKTTTVVSLMTVPQIHA